METMWNCVHEKISCDICIVLNWMKVFCCPFTTVLCSSNLSTGFYIAANVCYYNRQQVWDTWHDGSYHVLIFTWRWCRNLVLNLFCARWERLFLSRPLTSISSAIMLQLRRSLIGSISDLHFAGNCRHDHNLRHSCTFTLDSLHVYVTDSTAVYFMGLFRRLLDSRQAFISLSCLAKPVRLTADAPSEVLIGR